MFTIFKLKKNTGKPEVIFENDRIVVVNKPAGMNVHPDGKNSEYTLSDWMVKTYPQAAHVGEPLEIKDQKTGEVTFVPRHGIVHRLDKETSGVIVLAKDQKAFIYLKNQFQKHTIKKTYRAFVYGHLRHDIGAINAPIGRSSSDIRKWNSGRGARGELREALTRYRVLKRFVYENEKYTFLELYPLTGRTHQIRVHLRFINHPIVSDFLYASTKEKALGFNRVALHAYTLEILVPGDEKPTIFTAKMPKDFNEAESIANSQNV